MSDQLEESSDATAVDDAVAAVYWDRYEALLLDPTLLGTLAEACEDGDGAELLDLLGHARTEILNPDQPLEQATERRLGFRVKALLKGAAGELSDYQTAVAELFIDLLLMQRGIAEDVLRAERERAPDTPRFAIVRKYDEEQDLVFERLLPNLVRPQVVENAIPASVRPAVEDFARERTPHYATGVLPPVAEEARLRVRKTSSGQSAAAAPATAAPAPEPAPPAIPPARQVPEQARQNAPLEWTSEAPPFRIPEWRGLGRGTLRPGDASRHFLITGETGSGKTKSAILPLVAAALRYPGPGKDTGGASPGDLAPSMLVIDPKREVEPFVEELNAGEGLGRTLIRFEPGGDLVVDMFEGIEPLDLTAEGAFQRIFAVSSIQARQEQASAQGNSLFFNTQSEMAATQLLETDLYLYRHGGTDRLDEFWRRVSNRLQADGHATEPLDLDPGNYLGLHAAIYVCAAQTRAGALDSYLAVATEMEVPQGKTLYMRSLRQLAEETMTSVIAGTVNLYKEVGSPDLTRDIWLDPFRRPDPSRTLSVRRAMDDGLVVCYTPDDTSDIANAVGRAIKSKFFEYTFRREARERPFVYVCDEFQRFITNDPISGEQSFLDRCRAFRGVCVLATQSIASLHYALATDGASAADRAAIEVLLNNTGNKLFFRNTDTETHQRLQQLIPKPYMPGKPHLLDVRPVSTLEVGECYFLFSDGEWGRRQVDLEPR